MFYLMLEKILTMLVLILLVSAFAQFNSMAQVERGATHQTLSAVSNPIVPVKVQKLVKMSSRSNPRKPASL